MYTPQSIFRGWFTLSILAICSAEVTAQTLGELFDGGSVSVGGATFENFQLTFLEATTVTGPDFSAIDVVGINTVAERGLSFSGNGQLMVSGTDALTFEFEYSVSGDPLIANAALTLGEPVFGAGGGNIFMAQDIIGLGGADLGSSIIDAGNTGVTTFSASLDFHPQPELTVKTILSIEGDVPGDSVSLASFRQTFAQVPEPSTGLAGYLCLIVLMATRRRRR